MAIARVESRPSNLFTTKGFSQFKGILYVLDGTFCCSFSPACSSNEMKLVFGRHDWLGTFTVGRKSSLYLDFEQISSCRLLYFPGKEIERLAQEQPLIFKWLFEVGKSAMALVKNNHLITTQNRHMRTAFTLLELSRRMIETPDARQPIEISQSQLSRIVGISRPRINEVLKSFEQRGDVSLSRSRLVIEDVRGLGEWLNPLAEILEPRPEALQLANSNA